MTIVDVQIIVKKKRESLKKKDASKELLYKLERIACELGIVINQMKIEGFDPEAEGI